MGELARKDTYFNVPILIYFSAALILQNLNITVSLFFRFSFVIVVIFFLFFHQIVGFFS